ncbi:AEC family transporter [Vibrio alginolyticus]|uniref:AEC family transporter n=1 Tax=Vibrio TaxID=662 RepID=UPI00187ED15E|nr:MULTISPECIES: AEC family transporter [Vibrio]MDG2789094.1 AEC family transporter [Vibrio parahaemolyticus]MBE8570585.1 AEC family transporter [Vibrio sp. OPT46]MBE8579130.1 AEC family transporter [Vibrio sp. OPT41]MBS9863170.1 AEC family transporter [Vibrio alginolyticus]MBS9886597.1 AEC family transporter [Vibrio alginolyticus]
MFELVIGILFPLFSLVAMGYGIGRWIKMDFLPINRINMDMFLPALVFSSVGTMPLDMTQVPLLSASLVAIFIPGLLMVPICRLFKLPYKVWAPPHMFRNSANLAIPLFTYTFGEDAIAPAVLLLVVSVCTHVSLGLTLVSKGNPLKQVVHMPMFIAAIVALILNLTDISIWEPLYNATALLGQTAVPIMLLSLGTQMCNMRLSGLKVGLLCTLQSLATGAVTFGIIYMLIPLPTMHLQMMLLFSMLPPAVMNYLLAERFGLEPAKVASMVLFGNFLSIVTLPVLLTIALSLEPF